MHQDTKSARLITVCKRTLKSNVSSKGPTLSSDEGPLLETLHLLTLHRISAVPTNLFQIFRFVEL